MRPSLKDRVSVGGAASPLRYGSNHNAGKALEFDGEDLMQLCMSNPSFGFQFMHRAACTLAERLSGTRLQLLEVGGVHLPEFQLESD